MGSSNAAGAREIRICSISIAIPARREYSREVLPKVSCVMPTTAKRASWIRHSIRYYQRQSYPCRELIILSDGPEWLDLPEIEDDKTIFHYHRPGASITLGAKRNRVNSLATGSIIAHWDDDDWYSPDRIEAQVDALLATKDADVCGLRDMLWMQSSTRRVWRYDYPENIPGVCGNTAMYHKAYWETHPIPDVAQGSDTGWFLENHPVVAVPASPFIAVGLIHDDNVSPKQTENPEYQPWRFQASVVLHGDAGIYK